jgi:hypothetical protein
MLHALICILLQTPDVGRRGAPEFLWIPNRTVLTNGLTRPDVVPYFDTHFLQFGISTHDSIMTFDEDVLCPVPVGQYFWR